MRWTCVHPQVAELRLRCPQGLPRAIRVPMIERVFDDVPGLGRAGVPAGVAARRARSRGRVQAVVAASTGWPRFAPQVGLAEGPLGVAQAAERELARCFAARARALAAFAISCPPASDRVPGEPGAMSAARWAARPEICRQTSEWTGLEVSIGLTCSPARADALIEEESLTLVQRLPGTLAGMEGGLLTAEHRRPMLEHVAPIRDDALRGAVEAELLRWVAARAAQCTITTPPQLGDKARRLVLARTARDRAQEALAALRRRGVFRRSGRGEGLAGIELVGGAAEIAVLLAALRAYADAADDPDQGGDPGAVPRSEAQRMLDCLMDLVLRPGGTAVPVRVVLTVVAGAQTLLGGDGPAEIDGQPVAAETARTLLRLLTGSPLGAAALAELRHLAEAADTAAADAEDAAADTDAAVPASGAAPGTATGDPADAAATFDPAASGAAPGAAAGDPADDAAVWGADVAEEDWTPAMRADLARWEADWARRLAAGEFDDPEPLSDAEQAAAAQRSVADGWVQRERELTAAQDRWWAEFHAGLHTDPDPDSQGCPVDEDPPDHWPSAPAEAESPSAPPTQAPAPRATAERPAAAGGGWWADADRALTDASTAMLAVDRALAHA